MAIIQGNAKQGSTRGFYPKVINGSLRFNDDDSAYLNWTPASAGNRKTWTWSGWVKRGNITSNQVLFAAGNGTYDSRTEILLDANDNVYFINDNRANGGTYNIVDTTGIVFRDSSAWYHFVVAIDTTQSTDTNRVKMYVNGQQLTLTQNNGYPAQNLDTFISSTSIHYIGKTNHNTSPNQYLDAYLANVHFIDGQALTADDFGETKNGVWIAKDYAGTFGTNGFYLTFEDDTQVEAFNTVLFKPKSGVNSITGMGFKPDLVWLKSRSNTQDHYLVDSVRGGTSVLRPSTTGAESIYSTPNWIISFDSDGFTTSTDSLVTTNYDYVAWCWKAGDSNVSNTDGTITSTVRANDTYGFSIVSYTGNGTTNATVGHGLSSAPDFVICKDRDTNTNNNQWHVYHSGAGDQYLYLSDTAGAAGTAAIWPNGQTNTLSVGDGGNYLNTNESGDRYIAYCWSETTGYSKFGSYTGTGTTTGNTVTLGFRPAFLLIKRTDTASTNGWYIWDGTRNVGDYWDTMLYANLSNGDDSGSSRAMNVTDTTFQPASTDSNYNASGGTYIYAAFADTREAAFWLDQSGNDNDWQPVNLDHNDTVADSPTNNFCTVNPLTKSSGGALQDGNLVIPFGGTYPSNVLGTIGVSTGKWYWEVQFAGGTSANGHACGVATSGWANRNSDPASTNLSASGIYHHYIDSRQYFDNNSTDTSNSTSFAAGDIIGVALDCENDEVSFYKNNVLVGSAQSLESGQTWFPFHKNSSYTSLTQTVNFGQQDFTYTPPSGYLALSTANLPDPVIDPAQGASPEDYFNTVLYTGTITAQSITGVGFQPDLTWLKSRSDATSHWVTDAVRTVSGGGLRTNTTDSEVGTAFTSFDSDGFSLNIDGSLLGLNKNGQTYVAWNWKANGSGVTNTDGSITSTVSANTTSGFSIVGYNSGTSGQKTVGHGLDSAPELIITKSRDSATFNWSVFHHSVIDNTSKFLRLNTTDAIITSSTIWGAALPTSDVFGITSGNGVVASTECIAYCFHSVEGFSKFGSYTGNGSTDGSFVYCGFRPVFVMVKRTDTTNNWYIHDTARDTENVSGKFLYPNLSNAEADVDNLDILSNGFKLRTTATSGNASGGTYIYMAFAENPFKYSNAR